MLTKTKKEEVLKQIHELMTRSEESIVEILEKASTSGALNNPDMIKEGNYLLAKAIITIYFRKDTWAPRHDSQYETDVQNLSHFL